jgi:hypothetical protein
MYTRFGTVQHGRLLQLAVALPICGEGRCKCVELLASDVDLEDVDGHISECYQSFVMEERSACVHTVEVLE